MVGIKLASLQSIFQYESNYTDYGQYNQDFVAQVFRPKIVLRNMSVYVYVSLHFSGQKTTRVYKMTFRLLNKNYKVINTHEIFHIRDGHRTIQLFINHNMNTHEMINCFSNTIKLIKMMISYL
jgi:hypothetical protein